MRTNVMKLMLRRVVCVLLLVLGAVVTLFSIPVSATPFAYVADGTFDEVLVVDVSTNTVINSIPVGLWPWGIAVTLDGSFVYVTNSGFYGSGSNVNTVSVIDARADSVVATIPVGDLPMGIAVTPDGSLVYVANYSHSSLPSTVSVIDTKTNAVTATIPVGSGPRGIAITPDGSFAYVANYGSNNVSVIATASNTVLGAIPVGVAPIKIAISPDGSLAYVTNYHSSTISVVLMVTNQVVATIQTDPFRPPVGVAFTPDGTTAYVVNTPSSCTTGASGTLSVIDVASGTVMTTISVGACPWGIAVTPDGNFAYVTDDGHGWIYVISTKTNTVETTINALPSSTSLGWLEEVAFSQNLPIDTTPPVIIPTVTGTLGNNGWYTGDVKVEWSVTDNESPISSKTGCDTTMITSDTSGTVLTCSATSNGGTSSKSVTIKRDATPPLVTVTGVANGATYTLGSVPVAWCSTTDAFSGVQTNASLSMTGGSTNGVGSFTASCTGATDKAGNPGAASVTYQVNAPSPGAFSTFSAFNVNQLRINQRLKTMFLLSNFTLGKDSNGIDPVKDTVTLTIANFTTTIPAGSFRKGPAGVYAFAGKINTVSIEALITPLGSNRFGFQAAAYGANLSGTKNPVAVGLTIGDDSGTTSVNAVIK